MRIHLLDNHRKELVTHLPIRDKGSNMDYRTAFVIDFLKRRKPPEFYDHRTAEFVPLDKPEIQKVTSDPNEQENLDEWLCTCYGILSNLFDLHINSLKWNISQYPLAWNHLDHILCICKLLYFPILCLVTC
ncbi:MAG: hypothetical protein WBF33_28630 [Candidatus Nitrosopolaris sp.]